MSTAQPSRGYGVNPSREQFRRLDAHFDRGWLDLGIVAASVLLNGWWLWLLAVVVVLVLVRVVRRWAAKRGADSMS